METFMTKIFSALIVAAFAAAILSPADAAQGCGRGWHRNWHGYCVRNHRVAVMPPPAYAPPAPPTYVQQITPPARTGVIPGSANSAHSVCSYGYHPGPNGQCQPN
jgi:hypothetical protein